MCAHQGTNFERRGFCTEGFITSHNGSKLLIEGSASEMYLGRDKFSSNQEYVRGEVLLSSISPVSAPKYLLDGINEGEVTYTSEGSTLLIIQGLDS